MAEYDDITGMIERSSLGTPAARALRALTPRWVVAEILRRTAQFEERSYPSSPVPSAEFEFCLQVAAQLLAQLEEAGRRAATVRDSQARFPASASAGTPRRTCASSAALPNRAPRDIP